MAKNPQYGFLFSCSVILTGNNKKREDGAGGKKKRRVEERRGVEFMADSAMTSQQ